MTTNSTFADPQVTTATQQYRTVLQMLIQFAGGQRDSSKTHNEKDLLEALDITQQVITSRLQTTPNEWKKDDKQQYKALFNSIETEAKEAVHIYFSSPTEIGTGFLISKFQQLVIEPIVQILRKAGPEQGKTLIPMLIEDAKHTVINIERDFHQDDIAVARYVLNKYTQQRKPAEQKAMTKKQRLELIAKVVERMQISEEEIA